MDYILLIPDQQLRRRLSRDSPVHIGLPWKEASRAAAPEIRDRISVEDNPLLSLGHRWKLCVLLAVTVQICPVY
jgi:hypothetical protein